MMVGRASPPTPFAAVPGASATALSPRILARPQLGGDLREEKRVETGSARSGPGMGSRAETELVPGRSESGPREEGPGPLRRAHQVALGQVARARRRRRRRSPGPGLRPLPRPRPRPSAPPLLWQNSSAKSPKSRSARWAADSNPTRRALLSGWGRGRGQRIHLGPGDVSMVEDPEEASSQALQEPATNWRAGGQGRGTLGRMRVGVGGEPQQGNWGQQRSEKEGWGAGGPEGEAAGEVAEDQTRPWEELASWCSCASHTHAPHGKKVDLEMREQAKSGARHPRPWRPNLGNQVPGKTTFHSAHQKPCPGGVEPRRRALAEARGSLLGAHREPTASWARERRGPRAGPAEN